MPVVDDYSALLSGSYWNGFEVTATPVIVTFSFPTDIPAYDADIPGFSPDTLASFQAFTATEQAQAITALNAWAAASGVVFIQVAAGAGDINFQNVDLGTSVYAGAAGLGLYPGGAWNYDSYPAFSGDLDASGDVFMNTADLTGGAANDATLLHEIGHALGLKHPTEVVDDAAGGVLHDAVLAADDPALTVMASVGDTTAATGTTLLALDRDAAAFIYGPAGTGGVHTDSASGSNAVVAWSWDATTQTLTQSVIVAGAAVRGSSVNDVLVGSGYDDQLFGLAGNDVLNAGDGNDCLTGGSGLNLLIGGQGSDSYFVSMSTDVIVEHPDEGTDVIYASVSYTMADNVEVMTLTGSGLTGRGNDQGVFMYGDLDFATRLIGGTGNDYLSGGAGNDILRGGGGVDLMFGGAGDDRFAFASIADAAIGCGCVLTTIGDFTDAEDRIDLSGITTTGGQPLFFIGTDPFSHVAGQVHQVTAGTDTLVEGDVDGDGTADFQIQLDGSHTLQTSDFVFSAVPCYRSGTRILTDGGECAVEDLAPGDRIATVSGRLVPVTWIGHRRIDCRRHPDPRRVWPVRVRADAFAAGQPRRDLFLSPDHAVFVDGLLIPIKHLINGATIAQVPVDTVTYHHVELPRHDVMFAEGLAAESYLDTGNRRMFANGGGAIALHPAFGAPQHWHDDAAAPLAVDAARVKPAWQRLAARAQVLGWSLPAADLTEDPAVRLRLDDRILRPIVTGGRRFCFVLPSGNGPIRLLSRAGYPTDRHPWAEDGRWLGVNVSRIVWQDRNGPHDLPVDHPALCQGWWDVERSGHRLYRWTNGDAGLPPMPGATMLSFDLEGGMAYRRERPAAAEHPATRAAG